MDKTKDPSVKDLWATPSFVFEYYRDKYGLVHDAAASADNAKLPSFWDKKQDGLLQDWGSVGAIWCNPPYSEIQPWVSCAASAFSQYSVTICMLLPSCTDTKWFSLALASGAQCQFLINGRLQFINHKTGKTVGGNTRGSLVMVWSLEHMAQPFCIVDLKVLKR